MSLSTHQRKQSALILALTICLILSAPLSQASSQCRQTFYFFGCTAGVPTFWIGQSLSGQCQQSQLLQVALNAKGATVVTCELKQKDDWDWVNQTLSHLRNDPTTALVNQNHIWKTDDGAIQLTAPPAEPTLTEQFQQHIIDGNNNALSWNQQHQNQGIITPKFHNTHAELLYHHPAGLYLNYHISNAFFCPKSQLLIVFTEQPTLAVGLDSMHGFLIFKMTPEKPQVSRPTTQLDRTSDHSTMISCQNNQT